MGGDGEVGAAHGVCWRQEIAVDLKDAHAVEQGGECRAQTSAFMLKSVEACVCDMGGYRGREKGRMRGWDGIRLGGHGSGFGVGQVNLGCCYESGNGCKQDTAQAVHWYRKAAEQGNKDALFNLGRCYQRSADESQTGGSHSNDHDSTHVSLDVSDEGSDYVSMDMSQYSSASETANDISESSMRSVRSSHSRPSHSRCRSQKLPSSVSPKLAFSVSPQASKQNTVSPQATKQNTKRPV